MTRLKDALSTLTDTSARLSRLSQNAYQNPYETVAWPTTVDPAADWFSSPELLSLYGTEYWDGLDEATRCRLGFLEAANFYSLNIHGEKSLMKGLAGRLYRPDLLSVTEYLHHFLDEENKHSVYFGGFCARYAKVYRSRQVAFETDQPKDVADFLFFAKTMIFEEIVDRYNRVQAKDVRLHPLARFINANHHREEARHLVFGRELVSLMWDACAPSWGSAQQAELAEHLTQFLAMSWREYYNPDVYADLGLAEPWQVAEEAWSAPAQRRHRQVTSARCLGFLTSRGILPKEPVDAF
jgi:hypothetical protein